MLFQSLANTVDWSPAQWRALDDFHKFRNRFEYGDIFELPEHQVESVIAAASSLT